MGQIGEPVRIIEIPEPDFSPLFSPEKPLPVPQPLEAPVLVPVQK